MVDPSPPANGGPDDGPAPDTRPRVERAPAAAISLAGSQEVTPTGVPIRGMSELERAGVQLAHIVLALIGAIAVLVLMLIAKSEFHDALPEVQAMQTLLEQARAPGGAASAADLLTHAAALADKVTEARRQSREFWRGIAEFMLLNLLLPVLTAILGYIFGTVKGDR